MTYIKTPGPEGDSLPYPLPVVNFLLLRLDGRPPAGKYGLSPDSDTGRGSMVEKGNHDPYAPYPTGALAVSSAAGSSGGSIGKIVKTGGGKR